MRVRLCEDRGITVGLHFTMPIGGMSDEVLWMLELMEHEAIDKFCLSHRNYAGRLTRLPQLNTEFHNIHVTVSGNPLI